MCPDGQGPRRISAVRSAPEISVRVFLHGKVVRAGVRKALIVGVWALACFAGNYR
jgi:hypothetical protein